MKIRAENPSDVESITCINDAAFGQKAEGLLVCALRKDPAFDPQLSLVAELENVQIIEISDSILRTRISEGNEMVVQLNSHIVNA